MAAAVRALTVVAVRREIVRRAVMDRRTGVTMKLARMKPTKEGGQRLTIAIADREGREDYELAVRGPKALISRVFEKADAEIEIDPNASTEIAQKRFGELRNKYSASAKPSLADDGKDPFKKPQLKIDEKASVVISLYRTRGAGTFWAFYIPLLFVPRGANLFFILPPVFTSFGAVYPLSGDPDLFLTLNGALTPTVAMSIRGGTAVDSVAFGPTSALLPSPFVPFFRVNGFASGLTGFFMAGF